jgi:hypothetical protein
MIPYLKGFIMDFPEEITGRAASAVDDHLFTVREDHDRDPLDESRTLAFHHTVAQLLCACPRAQKDLQTAIAFLTRRVRSPYEDDWEKLKRVLRYLKSTINIPLILRADNLNIIKWWVDASYACHGDCRGHTGAIMSLGKSSVSSMSKKQKINTRSSTGSDLGGADDTMPGVMWTILLRLKDTKLRKTSCCKTT